MFYYIPNASLAAVIIHAVSDLITPPNTVYRFWLVSPFKVFIFFVGVIVTVFSTIENGIYCSVCLSAAMLLFRILRSKGHFLGRVKVQSVLGNYIIGEDRQQALWLYGTFTGSADAPHRDIFLPITHADGSNPEIELDNPYPGIFIYRFSEGFNYPNASHTLESMVQYIFANTRRTNLAHFDRPGDRPWNDAGPSRHKMKAAANAGLEAGTVGVNQALPTLKTIILDFSSVNHVDITSVQQLIDVRNQLDRYAAPNTVDWHIACINNRWTRRALVSAGFGYPTPDSGGVQRRWKSIFSVAEIGGSQSAAAAAELEVNEKEFGPAFATSSQHQSQHQHRRRSSSKGHVPAAERSSYGLENADVGKQHSSLGDGNVTRRGGRAVAVHGLNRPLFHVDLTSALQSAMANVEARDDTDTETRIGLAQSGYTTKTTL